MRFSGKKVLVTGGASGVGKATAELFGQEGASLVVADLNLGGAQQVASRIAAQSKVSATPLHFDAADEASCRRLVSGSIEALGGLDVLCNIAGVMDWDHLDKFDESRWDRVLRINLTGVFHLKAGVVALTKSLAIEFAAAGVRVNALCPTGGKTPMHEQNRFPDNVDMALLMRNAPKMYGGELWEPRDVAVTVLFLASDEARYISGVALPVDGAQTAG